MVPLKIIPFYTSCSTLDEALQDPNARKLLWLEILLNDAIQWKDEQSRPGVKIATDKARRWYGHFKSLLAAHRIRQRSLKPLAGKIDFRDYRRFLEAVHFVSP